MEIDKFISPFIASQFPNFYQTEGTNFIAFMKAYYEWMESENNAIYQARSLLDYRDIDSTLPQFVKYFKDKYMDSIPENIKADKKLLLKHILELYRSKGSTESYKLLFRILFNEDIEVYIPNQYVFKLSDNNWITPKYIEVSDNPYLVNLIGQKIYSSSTLSTAVVDNYFTKSVNNKIINVLYLIGLEGNFHYGEKILCEAVPQITIDTAPVIFGSLSSVTVVQGGINYNIGDVLTVEGSGYGALAKVAATRSKNGEVTFELIDGGSGFSTGAIISVDGAAFNIVNATNTNPVVITTSNNNTITNGQSIRIDYVDGMIQLNSSVYNYYAKLINSTSFSVYSDPTLSTPLNGTTFNAYSPNSGYVYINTGGSGATFNIGSIVNKQIYKLNTDYINTYYNTILDSTISGYNIAVSSINGTFSANNKIYMSNVSVRELDCNVISTSSVLSVGENLSNSSQGIANLTVCISDNTYVMVKGSDVTNANLASGVILKSNTSNTYVLLNTVFPVETINATANVVTSNSTVLGINAQNGYFLQGEKIYNSNSTSNAVINSVTRNTNWVFQVPLPANLDQSIQNILTTVNKEVGTIASITDINPGTGYASDPVVSIVEPLIYDLRISDPVNGGIEGFNAYVKARAGYANGIVTAITIVDSGFGYDRDQVVNLLNSNNNYAVTGTTVVDINGIGQGYWTNHKSFVSDVMKIQDSNFYQNYSYQIIAERMIDTYKELVYDLVHPIGIKLFGTFAVKDNLISNYSQLANSYFVQS
jgi:hypothetical protein